MTKKATKQIERGVSFFLSFMDERLLTQQNSQPTKKAKNKNNPNFQLCKTRSSSNDRLL